MNDVEHKRPLPRTCVVTLFVLACSAVSHAAPNDDFDAVGSGGEALEDVGALPWYDGQADDLAPVEVPPPDPPPDYAGVEERLGTQNRNFGYPLLGRILYYLALAFVVALLIAGLGLLLRAMLKNTPTMEMEPSRRRRLSSQVDRMEQLPVPIRRAVDDLLAETRRQYEQGNYNEAIIYLYSYILVELDKGQHIRLVRGKTNRQYLWELRELSALRDLVEQTMIAFEDVFFGDHDLDRARFESCYQRLDELHQYLEPVPA